LRLVKTLLSFFRTEIGTEDTSDIDRNTFDDIRDNDKDEREKSEEIEKDRDEANRGIDAGSPDPADVFDSEIRGGK